MRTLAVVPVKRFAGAKQRLQAHLDERTRRALAEAMVGDVLEALSRCSELAGTLVVTREERAIEMATRYRARVVLDTREAGQSAAAALGLARVVELGIERALLVPGDCPGLDPGELDALLAAGPAAGPAATIVPDRHGTGTNALLLCPPGALEPRFGPGSFERHVRSAVEGGTSWTQARPESLTLDIDTRDDLASLQDALGRWPLRASRTRRVLERHSG